MESYTEASASADAVSAGALEGKMRRVDNATAGYGDARQNVGAWRKEASECRAFDAGWQWSDEDLQKMQDEKRAPVVFNRIAPYVNAVVGTEIQNREAIRFNPRETGDVRSSGMLGDVFKWVRDEADSDFEESDAFRDMVITGMGCTGTTIDYIGDPDGIIREDRVDPMVLCWPSRAVKRNLVDAPEVYRTWVLTPQEAKAMFPKYEGEFFNHALGFGVGDYKPEQPVHQTSGDNYRTQKNALQDSPDTDVMVVERQYWELEDYYRVAFTGGSKIIDLSAENYQEMEETIAEAGGKVEEFHRRRYYRCYYTGEEEIEHEALDPGHPGFTYKFMTGRYDPIKRYFFGLVRPLIDPQNWGNKTFSNILHVMSVNAKGGVLYETGAFKNKSEAERKWADPSGMIEVEEGALRNGSIIERKPAEYPTGLHQILEFTLMQPAMVTGANPEFMGQASANQPGVLEAQRKQSGLAILAWLFDAMRAYRKEKARLLLFYIQNYIPDGRLIRIVGDQGAKYAPLMLDRSVAQYDIVLENAPTSPNQKAHTFATLMQMMPMIVKAGIPIPPEMFTYSDLPTSLAQAFAQAVEESRKPDPKKQQMQEQAFITDMKERWAKIAKDETQADYNRARAEEVLAALDLETARAASERELEIEKVTSERMKVVGELQNPKDVTFN